MSETLINIFSRLNPAILTGPIFDKELRISSRRKSNYWLRCIYLALLAFFIIMAWLQATVLSGGFSNVVRISRMAEIGRTTIVTIIWFQFIATQLIAVVMLSNAVSEEISKRTYAVMLTTPITNTQFILGKFFSKIIQLILLLILSFPVLVILRIMGGMPWNFVTVGFCVTFTAVLFAAAVSLLISIVNRQAWSVIFLVTALLALLYGLLPLILNITKSLSGSAETFLLLTNPYYYLIRLTENTVFLRGSALSLPWVTHCLFMIVASGLVLFVAALGLRKTALRQAFVPRTNLFKSTFFKKIPILGKSSDNRLRPVNRKPIIWRELLIPPLIPGFSGVTTYIVLLVLLLILNALLFYFNFFDEPSIQIGCLSILLFITLIRTATYAASTFTREKEARTLTPLLTTPLSDDDILRHKALASFLRSLPLWAIIFTHLLFFSLAGIINSLSFVIVPLMMTGPIFFLIGSGVYFSTRLKTTTKAVVATFALALGTWFICPCCGMANPFYILFFMSTEVDEFIGFYFLFCLIASIVELIVGFCFYVAAKKHIRCNLT
ncbi:MAG: ABC transporter permease subunit [Sedimentisphaerales bacterium]|nr:ABC transporter permease subunit [Sedimentisphaerales bacterium]